MESIRDIKTMTEQEQLFLNTISDIKDKLSKRDSYSIIRGSGLLRHLLIDGEPLVHVVNRKFKLKIEFETLDFTFKIPIRPLIHWKTLDASAFPNARKIRVDLKGFLGADCLTFKDHDFTVKDILKACAHIKGGVHSGVAKTDKDKDILNLDEVLKVGGLDATLAALVGILRVTFVALEPLVEGITKEQTAI